MYALPRTLPEKLSALTELALDLRWTWSHALDVLWQTIDPELWARSPNPWVILQNIPQNRLDELGSDSTVLQVLNRAIENRRCYLAGGLGVLAGDYLKTASDLDAPVIGIGLLYQEGYFCQIIDANGDQREAYPHNAPTSLPIQPMIGADGAWLKVELRLPGRMLFVRVWQAIVGRTRL